MMIKELIIEESEALNDFKSILQSKSSFMLSNTSNKVRLSLPLPLSVLKDSVVKSGSALQECQLIESLDRQLRLLAETREKLNNLKKLNELNDSILNCNNLLQLVPLVLEWKLQQKGHIEEELSERHVETVKFVNCRLPEMIDGEIERVLEGWNDSVESRDQKALKHLAPYLRADSTNPLQDLFVSFPLSKLNVLLTVHGQLGNILRVQKTFPDRLLNRFYALLSTSTSEPFSVGLIESLVPERMKFATRISCILEATNYFIKLINDDLIPNFKSILMSKCAQIIRQIRKSAKESRGIDGNNVAVIDAQLNEICLIISTLSDFIQAHPETETENFNLNFVEELEKWKSIQIQLEELYLVKGIQRAIEMDQIVSGEASTDFPVSSCVDDIFYVLQASKTRFKQVSGNTSTNTNSNSKLISRAFSESFLSVLRRHLELTVEALKPINLAGESATFKPSRDLISTLVLINNLVATKSNWHSFSSELEKNTDNDNCNNELQNLFNYAVREGLHSKVLQTSIKKELQLSGNGEELFIKIHSLLGKIHNLFKSTLAKEALDELIRLGLGEFSQVFCKKVLFDDTEGRGSSSNTAVALRYDRLLHELLQWLEGSLNLSNTNVLLRLQQAICLLLTESKQEGQDLVDEWKKENSCQLRAGEILLILGGKNK